MNNNTAMACSHCGLPVPGVWNDSIDSPLDEKNETHFCCFGCRIAASVDLEGEGADDARWTLTRLGLAIFFSMTVMVFTLAMWTHDVYDDASMASDRSVLLLELFRYLCLLFSIPVLVLLGLPLFFNVVDDLENLRITTDLLIVVGVAAAFVYSVVSVFTSGSHVYFEVACMVLVAVTLGRWLEATGKQKATDSLRKLERLLPETAQRISDEASQNEQDVPLIDLKVGDRIRVLAGRRIPVDGVIELGSAAIDQKIVTGESVPKFLQAGDPVYAGTLNLDGDLIVQVAEIASAGALRRIVDAVRRAALAKGRVQRLADRVATWFVPIVGLLAVTVLLVHALASGLEAGLLAFLAVLLIACPCALGIATPMAVYAALGRAINYGVLFQNGDSMEALSRVKLVCFDKTGTLTTGEAQVERFVVFSIDETTPILQTAFTLASRSDHHLSRSICDYASRAVGHESTELDFGVETVSGRGLRALHENGDSAYLLGSLRWMETLHIHTPDPIEIEIKRARDQGKSIVAISTDGEMKGIFVLREQLRENARETIEYLKRKGIQQALLTGDDENSQVQLARSWGVEVAANLLPDDKHGAVARLQQSEGIVAMVGDGINDAPALSQADIGIAMGCGADVARDAADVCLLGDDLAKIPLAIELSQQTMRTIRQNLIWAFAYNGVGIVLAAFGVLNPIWAAVLMVGSSLFVVSNSLRLANYVVGVERNEAINSDPIPDQPPPKLTGVVVHD